MREIDFFGSSQPRSSAERAKKIAAFVPNLTKRADFVNFGYQYFDSTDYGVGYGGYSYDGRYAASAERMIAHYQLAPGSRVLEIGCAKGFVLYEFHKRGMAVSGIDLSVYAVENAMADVKPHIVQGSCETLPWPDDSFDFVYSKETLPHLTEDQLQRAVVEAIRVCRTGNLFFEIQVSEHEQGRDLIKAWDETHQCIRDAKWWCAFLDRLGFRGQVNFKRIF